MREPRKAISVLQMSPIEPEALINSRNDVFMKVCKQADGPENIPNTVS